MIKVSCGQCQRSFSVAEQHAGKSGRCPNCQQVIAIPRAAVPIVEEPVLEATLVAEVVPTAKSPEKPVASAPTSLSREELLSAFHGAIQPVRTSWSYKLGVMLVSLVMLVLPLIYMALIVLVGCGIAWHFSNNSGMLNTRASGRGAAFLFLIFISPAFIGVVLIFFMIKPLFAWSGRSSGTRSLTREGEPLLFTFVDRICEAVGSARPSRIDVDCDVNASARFRNGLISMLTNDLVLTIGVPLAAGMTTRQFGGVLAHEFGHFSQGAGMRLSYLVRSINAWFQRVVYERDSWDEWLDAVARNVDFRIAIFVWLTMFFVWLTRRILWVLMMVGHAASSFFMREMEFDADRYETRLSGSNTFATTQRQVVTLSIANQIAQRDLQDFWREGRLGDNLPKLIARNVEQFTPEQKRKIDELINEEKTTWFATHPSSPERIASAAREQAPGIFQLEVPAALLFSNFQVLSKNVTGDFYREIFGAQFNPKEMHDTDALVARLDKQKEQDQALDRYCQGCFTILRYLPLASSTPRQPIAPQRSLERLKQTRQVALAEVANYQSLLKQYDEADTVLIEAAQAMGLLHAHYTIKGKEFKIPTQSTTSVSRARIDAKTLQGRLEEKLKTFENAQADRLFAALELLNVSQVAQRIEHAEQLQRDAVRYYETLVQITPHWTALLELRNNRACLGILAAQLSNHNSNELIQAVLASMKDTHRLLMETRTGLSNVLYPFDHAQGEISIGKYCVKEMPASDDLGGVHHEAGSLLDGYLSLYVRLLGNLAAIAEQVETAVGLPKLSLPEKQESAS